MLHQQTERFIYDRRLVNRATWDTFALNQIVVDRRARISTTVMPQSEGGRPKDVRLQVGPEWGCQTDQPGEDPQNHNLRGQRQVAPSPVCGPRDPRGLFCQQFRPPRFQSVQAIDRFCRLNGT